MTVRCSCLDVVGAGFRNGDRRAGVEAAARMVRMAPPEAGAEAGEIVPKERDGCELDYG